MCEKSVKIGHFSHVFHMVFHIHTPSSVQKMKTINLSVEHPALKDFVTSASMDCQSESTKTLSEFWLQVNSVSV